VARTVGRHLFSGDILRRTTDFLPLSRIFIFSEKSFAKHTILSKNLDTRKALKNAGKEAFFEKFGSEKQCERPFCFEKFTQIKGGGRRVHIL
jgi:hypothetical protein